jgi:hypothetical protein
MPHVFIIKIPCQMGETRIAYKILVGKPERKRDRLEDLSVQRKIISERILGKKWRGGGWWTGCI